MRRGLKIDVKSGAPGLGRRDVTGDVVDVGRVEVVVLLSGTVPPVGVDVAGTRT
jgi:hypothetical protein